MVFFGGGEDFFLSPHKKIPIQGFSRQLLLHTHFVMSFKVNSREEHVSFEVLKGFQCFN